MLKMHLDRKADVKLGHLSEKFITYDKNKALVLASSGENSGRFFDSSSRVITHQADVPGLLKAVEDEDEDLQQAHGQHEQRRRQARVLVLNIYTFNCSEGRGHANLVGVFVGDKKFHSLL